jgi:hypothetical protein
MTKREVVQLTKEALKSRFTDLTVEVFELSEMSIGMDIVSDQYGDLSLLERVDLIFELFKASNDLFYAYAVSVCPVDYAMYNERREREKQ